MEGRGRDLSIYGGKDPRDLPIYTVDEAAHILWLPLSTLKTWTFGKQWHDPSGKPRTYVPLIVPPENTGQLMLSFTNLIEAHVLHAIRRVHKIKMSKVREAMRAIREEFESLHPLAEVDLYTEGKHILIKYGTYMNMSAGKQNEMEAAISIYVKRIERDEGKIARFYPFSGEPRIKGPGIEEQPQFVSVDPFVSFGRPVIAGTNIRTEIIAERWWAGDSMDELAADYGLGRNVIEAAVRYESPRPQTADAAEAAA
jgi:uncharacterized protein (DUF433 family)